MRLIRYRDPLGSTGYAALQADGSARALDGDPCGPGGWAVSVRPVTVAKRLAPVVPSNIIGVGMNYRRHAEEGGRPPPERPVWFMKTTGAVQHPGQPIVLPRTRRSDEVDFEGELAVVIGRPCRNVTRARALDSVLGYTCANDVSARDWQNRFGGGQFCMGKSFDTFCPLGPELVTPDELPDPGALSLRTTVNGEVMQDWTTADLIFDVPTLIEFLSASRTLPAGTVILTGTPHGVGVWRNPPVYLKPGDTVAVTIGTIGTLANPVTEEAA